MNERENQPILIAIATVAVVVLFGSSPPAKSEPSSPQRVRVPVVESPVVDIPQSLRRRNWAPYGEGSCVHASMVMLLHWQGQHEIAEWWRSNHHSGEYSSRLARKMDAAGLDFASTTNGDVAFLEWAIRTRRGAGVVVMRGAHMVCLVHLDSERAGILDNNNINVIRWKSREQFISEWRRSGGWAVTPVYTPPPRMPW